MKNSDLFQLLFNLPMEDRKALRKFVRSPYHNLRSDVAGLYDFFEKHGDNNLAGLTKEAAHEALYPGQAYNDAQIRRCMNYLLKTVEQYLLAKEATANPLQNNVLLASAYRKLGLEKHARQSLEHAEAALQKTGHRHSDYYDTSFLFEAETLLFSQGTKRTAPRNLQRVSQSLDWAYLVKKLDQCCLAISHGAVANVAYDSGLLAKVLDQLEGATWLDEHPAIALPFYYYKAATTEDDLYFEKLKDGILRFEHLFPPAEMRKLYLLAINYTIQRYNRGEAHFLLEMFNLYQTALQRRFLLENDQLSRFAFKNIAGIAIRLGEFDWAQTFIDTYSDTVEPQHRRNYTDYNLAKLHYARRDFPKAMRLLHKVEYEDVFLSLDARVLLLKIYFEQKELDALESFLQSFQRFLNRKKELGYHRENYLNTLHFAHRLLALNPLDKKETLLLRQEIEQAKALGEREWLLDQL